MNEAEQFDRAFLWRFRADVLAVHDGDTLTVLADTGFNGRHQVQLRIANVWAPELSAGIAGTLAKARLVDILALRQWDDPWPLRIITKQRETVVTEVRSFERYVGDLVVVDAETGRLIDVATRMAEYGYGTPQC